MFDHTGTHIPISGHPSKFPLPGYAIALVRPVYTATVIGNESIPKIIINNTINLFSTAIGIC